MNGAIEQVVRLRLATLKAIYDRLIAEVDCPLRLGETTHGSILQ
jgi:hypothetical protein